MKHWEWIQQLNTLLLNEMPEYIPWAQSFPQDADSQRRLLRSLMNIRPPWPLDRKFLEVQDALLTAEREERGRTDPASLSVTASHPQIAIWQGDITRLGADAIVNAANSTLLGCFHPCHSCIDNAIHSAAGLQLRDECYRLMQLQGHPEPNGHARLTKGYQLPARYVLHTVGPMVQGPVTRQNREELASCYRSCLDLAAEHGLEQIAFCCISTGEFHFPHQEAAETAVKAVTEFLGQNTSIRKVIFNVFKSVDAGIYRRILGPDRAAEADA